MDKVAKQHKPPKHALKEPIFSLTDWAPPDEAYARAKACVGPRGLAEYDLIERLRNAQLGSAVRHIRDGSDTFELLSPSFWEGATFESVGGKFRIRNDGTIADTRTWFFGSRNWFFFARSDLDKLYPVAVAIDAETPTRVKPGPKPTGDWPTLLASWLIAVACADPKRLRNVDALVTEAANVLFEKIGWSPKEPKELRRKILELLKFVRD